MAVECVDSESKRRIDGSILVCVCTAVVCFIQQTIHSLLHTITFSFFSSFSSSVFSFPRSPSTCLLDLLAVLSHEALCWLLYNTATVAYSIAQKPMYVGMAKDVSKFSNQLLINTTVTTSLLLFIFFLFFFSSLISLSLFLLGVRVIAVVLCVCRILCTTSDC